MRRRFDPLAWTFLLAFACLSCHLPIQIPDDKLVTDLRFSPSAFDSFKQNTELRYSLKEPATVSILIARRDSVYGERAVATLISGLNETSGTHGHSWLGNTDLGVFAPAGNFLGILIANNHRFEAAVIVFHQ